MPLVMVAGHPCSGKSTAAGSLCQMLEARGLKVRLVCENDLCPDRSWSYSGVEAQAECSVATVLQVWYDRAKLILHLLCSC
jgi:uridine kinase